MLAICSFWDATEAAVPVQRFWRRLRAARYERRTLTARKRVRYDPRMLAARERAANRIYAALRTWWDATKAAVAARERAATYWAASMAAKWAQLDALKAARVLAAQAACEARLSEQMRVAQLARTADEATRLRALVRIQAHSRRFAVWLNWRWPLMRLRFSAARVQAYWRSWQQLGAMRRAKARGRSLAGRRLDSLSGASSEAGGTHSNSSCSIAPPELQQM